MKNVYKPTEKNEKYERYAYPRRQMRDTIEGSTAVKNAGELYLPMPSSFLEVEIAPSYSSTQNIKATVDLIPHYLPWNHPNPAFRAYLQRARFPDITANARRAMLGVATKVEPEVDLPDRLKYLEDNVSPDGESLEEFYGYLVSEVMTVGNVNIVVDVDDDTGEFYLTSYTAESTINWDLKKKKGWDSLQAISFCEGADDSGEEILEYIIDENGHPIINRYLDGDLDTEDSQKELKYSGKHFTRLPVFPCGSIENSPEPQVIPLLGISDIAISIYQENADLRQSHYLTCNPTLFIFGVGSDETPKVIGSQVCVGIKNPQGSAMYPATDTSALEHIRECIKDMYAEAATYGANFLTSGAKESGEALNVRQANRGANLVHAINMVSEALRNALIFIAEMRSIPSDQVVFEGNTEFAEMILNAQDINGLVTAWLQGAIDHDTLLDNLREAGYVDHEKTNDQIKAAIIASPPAVAGDDTEEEDSEEEEESDDEEEEMEEDEK